VPDAWTYSDWVTYESGSASRLSRLRLHVQEVSDRIAETPTSVAGDGGSASWSPHSDYLKTLLAEEKSLAQEVDQADGTRMGWAKARAI
jgi:hypothetical protein